MQDYKVDVLVFAAHPDDAELACSGTIVKHIQEGKTVAIVDLTAGELGTRGTPEIRAMESKKASEILGIHHRENLGLADGFFEIDSDSLLSLVRMVRKYQPEIVLCNADSDRHPDHGRGGALASRACFLAGLRKIETIDSDNVPQEAYRPKAVYHYIQDRFLKPDVVVDISDVIEVKKESILAFSSQFFDPNSTEPSTPISSPEFLEGVIQRTREMGRPAGFTHAEGFTVERFIGVNSLFDIQ